MLKAGVVFLKLQPNFLRFFYVAEQIFKNAEQIFKKHTEICPNKFVMS